MIKKIIYTAEHEEPNCIKCDLCTAPDCERYCGARKGWGGYQRTEIIIVGEKNEIRQSSTYFLGQKAKP